MTEQHGFVSAIGPIVGTIVVIVVVKPGNGIVIGGMPIESQSKVGILGNPAPLAVCSTGTPHDDIVAWEIAIAVIEIHQHEVGKFTAIHPLLIFCQTMTCLLIECLELVVVFLVAFFQVPPVFYHIDVFQSLALRIYVVRIDVVLVGALPDVKHTLIDTILEDDGGTPALPVEVDMLCHSALNDGITHIEVVVVVSCIAQQQRLKLTDSWPLVGEELVSEPFGAKALIGIDGQRLQGVGACGSTLYTGLTQLVDFAQRVGSIEELNVHRASPVNLLVRRIVCNNAYLIIIPIAIVSNQRDDGKRHVTIQEYVRLCDTATCQVAFTECLGTNCCGLVNSNWRRVGCATGRRFTAVKRVAHHGAFRQPCRRQFQL